MENRKFIVETKLDAIDYAIAVNDIANGYFDEENDYIPHIGKLKAMSVFYNTCVKSVKNDAEQDITGNLEVEEVIGDEAFIIVFNDAVRGDGLIRFDFANAFSDAMQIVDNKKNSFNNMVDNFRIIANKFAEKMGLILQGDIIDNISKFTDNFSSNNIDANSIEE